MTGGTILRNFKALLNNVSDRMKHSSGNIKTFQISPTGNMLVYKKDYSKDFIESTIRKEKLNGLRIFADLPEHRLEGFEFLSEFTFLESLSITSVDDADFSFLKSLDKLKGLSLTLQGDSIIDLSAQTHLQKLSIQWRKGHMKGLENCQNLKSLFLSEYKEQDLKPIEKLTGLTELVIKTASIKSLKGVEKLINIQTMLLGACRSLTSIADISYLTELRSLKIDMCRRIEDYQPLNALTKLEDLRIVDSGKINSINFLHHLENLKTFHLLADVDVVDGDLTPAQNIEDVFCRPRKHYNIQLLGSKTR